MNDPRAFVCQLTLSHGPKNKLLGLLDHQILLTKDRSKGSFQKYNLLFWSPCVHTTEWGKTSRLDSRTNEFLLPLRIIITMLLQRMIYAT